MKRSKELKDCYDSEILSDIYERLYQRAKSCFPEFDFVDSDNGWEATTGTMNGNKAKGHVYLYPDKPSTFIDNRNHKHISIWNYIKAKKGISTNQEVLKELAQLADYKLPARSSKKPVNENSSHADLLADALTFLKKQLFKEQGKKTLRYLIKTREYKKAEIKKMGFGHWGNKADLEKYLVKKGYGVEEVEDVFKYNRNNYKLVFPYKDYNGKITGLWCRTIDDNVEDSKYKSLTHPAPKTEFFNIHNKVKDSSEVIVVEGYFDAMIATERGMNNVVAIGGKNITKKQIEKAKGRSIKKIILAGDRDKEGVKATEHNIELILEHGLSARVVTMPKGYKDPDELMRDKGIKGFEEAVKDNKSAVNWIARHKIHKHDIGNDDGERGFIDDCEKFINNLKSEKTKNRFIERLRKRKVDDDILSKLKDVRIRISLEEIFDRLVRPASKFIKTEYPVKRPIVLDWIYDGDLIMVTSDTGIGKTRFCTEIIRGIEQGGRLLGGLWECVSPQKTMVIDGEMHYDDTKSMIRDCRLESTCVLSKSEWEYLGYQYTLDLNMEATRDIAFKKIKELGIKVLLIDNIFSLWHGLELNNADAWSESNQWLLKLRNNGVTVLLVHHTGKGGDQLGSSTKVYNLNSHFGLKGEPMEKNEEGYRLCTFSIKTIKTRAKTKMLTNTVLTCDDGVWTTKLSKKRIEKKKKDRKEKDALILLLDGSKTQEAIAKLAGFTNSKGKGMQCKVSEIKNKKYPQLWKGKNLTKEGKELLEENRDRLEELYGNDGQNE